MNENAAWMPECSAVFSHVLIVEDHPLFSDALSMTLQSFARVDTVTQANCLAAALDQIKAGLRPDMVLLDLSLPDAKGSHALTQLKRTIGGTPIIVVSSIDDDGVISAALTAGAAGYVPKHSQPYVLTAAFHCVAEGKTYLPDGYSMAAPAQQSEAAGAVRRIASLTPQQARILALICEGKLNKQIAWELSIAEATVKAHVTAIMRKLAVQSRTQAVLVAKDANFDKLGF